MELCENGKAQGSFGGKPLSLYLGADCADSAFLMLESWKVFLITTVPMMPTQQALLGIISSLYNIFCQMVSLAYEKLEVQRG